MARSLAPPARGTADRSIARRLLSALSRAYPDANCELDFRSPFELLVATILSAQCTDRRVNEVTPSVFDRYPTPGSMASADLPDLETLIRPTGFFRAKARSLKLCAQAITERFGGRVPRTLAELVTLPGVGRKTANVVLSHAYSRHEGIAVDTHVQRVANRLGLARATDAKTLELQLMALVPVQRYGLLSDVLIIHGRRLCTARSPRCPACPVAALCPSFGRSPAARRPKR